MRIVFLLLNILVALYTNAQCENTFKLALKGNGSDMGIDIVEIGGGDMIIAGETTSYGAGGKDIFLTRMTKDGAIVWNKYYGGSNDEEFRRFRLAGDGDILITGRTRSYGNNRGDMIVMKIDVNGNIKWSIKLGENTGYSLGLDILSTADNGIVVSGTNYADNGAADWLVAKVDALGNLLWSKRFHNTINEDPFSLIQKGDTIIVSGNSQTSINYTGLIVKMAVSDGTVYNTGSYTINNRGAFGSKIQYSSNEYRISLHIIDGNSYAQMQEGFVIMDHDLNFKKSFKLVSTPYENFYFTGFCQTNDGGFIVTGTPANGSQGTLYKFDLQSNLVYANNFSSTASMKLVTAFEASDLSIWIVGSENDDVVVMKLNADGQFENCPNQTKPGNVQPANFLNTSFTWSSVTTFSFIDPVITPSTSGFTFNVDSLCFAPVCKGIELTGEDAVCSITDTLTYTVTRDGACGSDPIVWSLPPTVYSENINDTTIRISFPATGEYTIKATNSSGCPVQDDLLSVVVKSAPLFIALGSDSVICNSATILLDAGPGFEDYTWQDNSKHQTFTATTSGLYYVAARNYCAQTLTDTINLTFRSPSGFAVSPGDTSYCIPSVIQFSAEGGDIYTWSPSTFLSDSDISNPTANPENSILYTVRITDTLCDRSRDLNVNILIDPIPEITLSKSNDLDCTIGTTQLIAQGAYSYQWTPASTLNDPNIANPIASPLETTIYKVNAFNSLGCGTEDSITVYFSKTGVSDFYIPNAFSPNKDGKNEEFKIIPKGAIKLKQFAVFNRWGEMVFSTTDVYKGWDGIYKGVLQLPGIYVWMVRVWSPCTGDYFKRGTVMLIK